MQLDLWAGTENVTVSCLRETRGHHPLFPWTWDLDWGKDQSSRRAPTQSGNCTLALTLPSWNWDRIKGWGFSLKNLAMVV